MGRYPFIALFERHGVTLSLAIALVFLGLGLLLVQQSALGPGAALLAVLGAAVLWLLLRMLTDIVRLLSETLIPRP